MTEPEINIFACMRQLDKHEINVAEKDDFNRLRDKL